ncbi:TldD/PmbA family protein [Alkaliphilus hydrothermalis]|uniref:PmbA protein n=1 Tax=Alkaliphilus hydrothermalis TaxID=1482730 RepID=A0ABS2NSJ0_9FIRM|nr:metallopeptidase TldD-related protein [Alkaliphilus hydrothermalis]MBM7615881.1 PmbA protein [Alkaliphilus hydrothermalis]
MKYKGIIDETIAYLKGLGADEVEVKLSESDDFEVYGNAGVLDLVRSVENAVLNVTVLKDQKRANTVINDLSKENREKALVALMASVSTAEPDPAYDLSAVETPKHIVMGKKPEGEKEIEDIKTKLTQMTAEFVDSVKADFPAVMLVEMGTNYKMKTSVLKNTKGTELLEELYGYEVGAMFNAVDEEKSSSFNYVMSTPTGLDEPFLNNTYWRDTIGRNEKELNAEPFNGRLEGNVMFAPTVVAEFLSELEELALKDNAFIQDYSKWKNSIGEQVCDAKLTWHSAPLSDEVGGGYGITEDGFPVEDVTVIENGVLKSHLLSLYGANKSGRKRAGNQGGIFLVEPGTTSLEKMISGIDRGILISRLSGGQPSPNGDFSGVAKNSFLIENGKIAGAVSEAMATFNIFEVLKDIEALSIERHDAGFFKIPYLKSNRVLVTGK